MVVRLVQLIHMMVLIFVLTGWLSPFPSWLWAHAFFIPLLVLHWRTNQNQCFLTQLEARLKEESKEIAAFSTVAGSISSHMPLTLPAQDVEEGQFIKTLWKKVLGRAPSDQVMEFIIYGAMVISWTFGVAHLILLLNGLRIS